MTAGLVPHTTLGVAPIPGTPAVREGTLPIPAACHATTVTAGLVRHATLGVAAISGTAPPTRAVRGRAVYVSAVRSSRTRAVCRGHRLIAARAVRPGRPLAAIHTRRARVPVTAERPGRRLMGRVRAHGGRVAVLLLGSVRRRLLRSALGRYAGGVRA
ncbi:hypothetical protein ABZ235_12570 [Streptomyces canus]|uniref:hypothetical protein n=1 Tax=Streptomyces canus TaxID=58343 RepID=UPI0033AFDC14